MALTPRTASSRHGFWTRHLLLQKMASPVGAGLLIIATLLFSLVIAYAGLSAGVVLLGAIIGLPVVAACLVDLRFGVMFLTTISYFLLEAKKIIDIPFGIFLDAGILLLFIGLLFRQASERNWSFANNPISWWVLIWISLNLLQVLNPVAASKEAWLYTVRGMAGTIVFYYIVLYTITDLAYALRLLKLVIFLSFLAGAFSMYQEFAGLTPWEHRWMMSDIEIYKLIYQAGRIRLFSFLSDPTTFGIMMAYMLVLCFTLAFGPWRPRTKALLVLGSIVMLLGCFWSGTRTAYIVIPAGIFFVTLASIAKRNWLLVAFSGIMMMGGILLVNMPTGNNTIYRFQTAFKPSKDLSYQVRLDTQARTKYVVQRHPFGGGLGSCGAWGARFSPWTVFASIAPDSGYVRVAVELGWIGLIFYMGLFFTAIQQCVKHMMRSRDPAIVNIYMGLGGVLFSLIIANYGQEATILLPNSIVFYIVLALVVKLKDFDPRYLRSDTMDPVSSDPVLSSPGNAR
jgi:putative inorganic carbon (HCO3(-)) transporter